MDFDLQYTREQEEFRQEVRAWLDDNANCPPELGEIPIEPDNMSFEMWQRARDFQRKLGAKGWLYPLWPREYGGGGLTPEHDIIIKEELHKKKYPVAYSMANMAMPPIFVYGTEEQKQRFLQPFLQGDKIPWQLFTEPSVGSDLASLITRADKDGDDFIINGQKTFVGGHHIPDYLWTLAVTDQDAPRHQNIGAFIVPGDLPGITINTLDLVVREGKRLISFDNVRVPREYLIGEENQGWRVAQTTLEIEHGAAGFVEQRDTLLEEVAQYCCDTTRGGQPISRDPFRPAGACGPAHRVRHPEAAWPSELPHVQQQPAGDLPRLPKLPHRQGPDDEGGGAHSEGPWPIRPDHRRRMGPAQRPGGVSLPPRAGLQPPGAALRTYRS